MYGARARLESCRGFLHSIDRSVNPNPNRSANAHAQTRKAQAEGARAAEAEAEKARLEAFVEREVSGFTKMTTMLRSELEKRLAELNGLNVERAAANEEKAAAQRRFTDLERQVNMGETAADAYGPCLSTTR